LGTGPQPQGSISLKVLMETRLKSESFQPLIRFLQLLVQKLNYKFLVELPMVGKLQTLSFLAITFEPETVETQ